MLELAKTSRKASVTKLGKLRLRLSERGHSCQDGTSHGKSPTRRMGNRDGRGLADATVSKTESAPDESVDAPGLAIVPANWYRLESEHASGGLGRVMVAYDHRLEREVAVKELLKEDAASDARFVREARLTARLQHPSIVPVYEAGRWPTGKMFYS